MTPRQWTVGEVVVLVSDGRKMFGENTDGSPVWYEWSKLMYECKMIVMKNYIYNFYNQWNTV